MLKRKILQTLVLALGLTLFTACGSSSSKIGDTNTSTAPADNNTSGTPTPTTITHNGTTYGFVTSPFTGKVWLDRNLGAARTCENLDDEACFGDYYQWGRNFDGHQDSSSGDTNITAIDIDNVGNRNFILNPISPFDWASIDKVGNERSNNWSKTDGTSICPVDFRVPTIEELKAETRDANGTPQVEVFRSFLKLSFSGGKSGAIGDLGEQGEIGYMWSSSIDGSKTEALSFISDQVISNSSRRANGLPVRCIKANPKITIVHNGTGYGFVTSPFTEKVWLDRNLGASRVCLGAADIGCYGDYYQWGRSFDGHQDRLSTTIPKLATSIENTNDKFITSTNDWTKTTDTNGRLRASNWSKTDGSSICPIGFNVPTIDEIKKELVGAGSAEVQNPSDAFHSFLKMAAGGSREAETGVILSAERDSALWSRSVFESRAILISIFMVADISGIAARVGIRADGFPVRCIKD